MDDLTLKYRKTLDSCKYSNKSKWIDIQKILALSERSNIDKLSLRMLRQHVDAMFKDILASYTNREEDLKRVKVCAHHFNAF